MQGLSVVLIAYDEEATLEGVVKEVIGTVQKLCIDYEIILVNDGSRDRTGKIARDLKKYIPNFRIIEHSDNRGYGAALKSGFANAAKDLIAFFPTDNQYNFNEIDRFLKYLNQADIVSGYRVNRQDTFLRKINALCWNLLIQILFGRLCRDIDCGFKVFKSHILEHVSIVSDGAMFDTELLTGARDKGFRITEVPVSSLPRLAGQATGSNIKVVIKAFRDLLMYLYRRSHQF
jgi:glycosyltransferase involved in cell wall biosynthesis